MIAYITATANFLPDLNQQTLDFMKAIGGFDLCMVAITIFTFHRGICRGFSEELSRVLGLVIAVSAGLLCLRVFDELVKPLSRWISDILPARFVLILLIVVACFILWVVAENVCGYCLKVPVSNRLDLILGGVLGLVKAVTIVLIICCICYLQPDPAKVASLEQNSWVFGIAEPLIERVMSR